MHSLKNSIPPSLNSPYQIKMKAQVKEPNLKEAFSTPYPREIQAVVQQINTKE